MLFIIVYVKNLLKQQDLYINLLPQRVFLDYARDPGIFRQELLAHKEKYKNFTCVVDEIQKIPALLDEHIKNIMKEIFF